MSQRSHIVGISNIFERDLEEALMLPFSVWQGVLTPEAIRGHQLWIEQGRAGGGRLDLHDVNLQGARVAGDLSSMRFVACDLSESQFSGVCDGWEAIDCVLDRVNFLSTRLRQSVFERCRMMGARMGLTHLDGARFIDVVLDEAELDRAKLVECDVVRTSFRRASLADARFSGARFRECDFRDAQLSRQKTNLDLAKMDRTHFVECDFRGATFAGLRMSSVTFERCRFAGASGPPELVGDIEVMDADLSPEGDGTKLGTAKDVLELLGVGNQ